MIKLIVSDIDGTLLKDGGNELNPELFDVILKLRKQGMQFAAATGRQWVSIERVFDPVNLYLNTVDSRLILEMTREIRDLGLTPMISGPDVVYLDERDQEVSDWMVNGYKYRVEQVKDLMQVQGPFIKVSAYCPSNVDSITKDLRAKYQDRLKIAISGDMWMDCMALGVNKGEAVKLLQESLGISPKETMVFGDQMNDIEMMGQAYYSFAVGNARPEVKAAARFQADRNVEDGVLKVLKLLIQE